MCVICFFTVVDEAPFVIVLVEALRVSVDLRFGKAACTPQLVFMTIFEFFPRGFLRLLPLASMLLVSAQEEVSVSFSEEMMVK
jgi:hypothetical protein